MTAGVLYLCSVTQDAQYLFLRCDGATCAGYLSCSTKVPGLQQLARRDMSAMAALALRIM